MNKSKSIIEATKIIENACITKPNELSLEEINLFIGGPDIVYEELNGFEGKFMSLEDTSIIIVDNKIRNEGRRRFTIAHELGHYILHREKNYIKCSSNDMNDWTGKKEIETEANYFASEILMPSQIFQKCSSKEKFSKSFLIHLTEEFNTSITSTALKFVEVGNDPIFLVCSSNGKIIWKFVSEKFPFKIDFYHLKEIPKTSVTHEVLYEGKNYNDSQEIDPTDWLISDEQNELRFFEDTICATLYNYSLSFISVRK